MSSVEVDYPVALRCAKTFDVKGFLHCLPVSRLMPGATSETSVCKWRVVWGQHDYERVNYTWLQCFAVVLFCL